MTDSKKVAKVNYTAEATATIVAAYKANPTKETVAEMATMFGKTPRSVIAKLSREGVYKAAEYVSKTGEKPETKETKVGNIALFLGVPAEKLAGLESATKATLDLIVAALRKAALADAAKGEGEGNAEGAEGAEGA